MVAMKSKAVIAMAGMAVAVAIAIAIAVMPRARIELPAAPLATATPEPAANDFLGSEACANCHQAEYQKWNKSTHGRAGAMPPRSDIVFARFNGAPIRFRDATVTPRVSGGVYSFTIDRPDEPTQKINVDGVVGGGHMIGGGTQGFVSWQPDGTLRFLPFEVTRRDSAWFCNTGTRANRGWQPITRETNLADCGDWPPVRVLGTTAEFASCQECHGSQIQLTYDSRQRRYATHVKSLAINCESCHGPGRRHVELVRKGASSDIGMSALSTLSKDQSLTVCFQCHALKAGLKAGYLPGKSLESYYSLALPLLGDSATHPDGRTKTFAYQQSHLSSDCYLNGSLTCVDCHDPHTQTYRTYAREPLASRFDDAQCTACHPSKAQSAVSHTHHPAASEGSRCTACHMPYTQEPDVGLAVKYSRSDHTISIPRPDFDARLGIQTACQTCHSKAQPGELATQVRTWYGELKPQPSEITGLTATRDARGDLRAAAKQLLHPDGRNAMAQAAGVSAYLAALPEPNTKRLDRTAAGRLRQLAASSNLDVKALALATLHYARGEDRRTRRFLADALQKLGPDDALVRRRWQLALAYLGEDARTRGDARTAGIAYNKALELAPNDADILLNAGQTAADAGDHATAIEYYHRSLQANPNNAIAYLNLGVSHFARGETAEARRAWAQDTMLNPYEPLAQFNLGNRALEDKDYRRAIALYARALQAAPGLAEAHFNLARAHLFLEEYGPARRALQHGLEFDPSNSAARDLLVEMKKAGVR
jgi:tetratricopeptide (TPR) repeat protein